MAGRVRHLLERNGRHYARVAVPEPLRAIVGRRELVSPLGADRTHALRKLPGALATMQATLETARAQHAGERTRTLPPRRGKPLSVPQMARAHYADQLQKDDAIRNAGGSAVVAEARSWSADAYLDALRRVASGRADDDEASAVIGASSAGLSTTAQPAASAGATPRAPIWIG